MTVSYVAQKVVGARGHWQIVNQHGGLISYFRGTKGEAERESKRLEGIRNAKK